MSGFGDKAKVPASRQLRIFELDQLQTGPDAATKARYPEEDFAHLLA
jgi:hypothetical protein